MMSLTFGLFTQVSGSGPLGPLVFLKIVSSVILENATKKMIPSSLSFWFVGICQV